MSSVYWCERVAIYFTDTYDCNKNCAGLCELNGKKPCDAVEYAEVVKGKWVRAETIVTGHFINSCSVCEGDITHTPTAYCPYCGAKMEVSE